MDRLGVCLFIEPVNFGARCHHFAHGPVGQTHDARYDGALALFDHAGFGGLCDNQVQFFRRHVIFRFAVHAEDAEDERAGAVEQPDQRRCHAREDDHRHCHDDGNRFWRAQGELLGHQFPHDQRGKGGEPDDKGEGNIVGPLGRDAKQQEALCDRAAKAGAGIGTCDDADQCDTNLDGGEEPPGIGRQ